MKIRQYRPGFMDWGDDYEVSDFETLEELLAIGWVHHFSKWPTFHAYARSEECLMVLNDFDENYGGCKEWWVVGTFTPGDLEIDLPDYRTLIAKHEEGCRGNVNDPWCTCGLWRGKDHETKPIHS